MDRIMRFTYDGMLLRNPSWSTACFFLKVGRTGIGSSVFVLPFLGMPTRSPTYKTKCAPVQHSMNNHDNIDC